MSFKLGVIAVVPAAAVEVKRPDPCWVARDLGGTELESLTQLCIFSSEAALHECHENMKQPRDSYTVEMFTWDELVDKYDKRYAVVVIDHKGDFKGYPAIPLRKPSLDS